MKKLTCLSVCVSLFLLPIQAMAGEKIDKSLSADNVSQITIENISGYVSVTGWDKNEVTVTGELDDKAEKLIFEKDGNELLIKVKLPKNNNDGFWGNKGSRLTIHMPKSIRMHFDGVSSDIDIESLTQQVEARTVSGNIKAKNLSEIVDLSSVSGDINSTNLNGKISLSTVSGEIRDQNSSGKLQLRAVSGEIETQSSAKEVTLSVVSGDMKYQLGSVDDLMISTVSGDSKGTLTLTDNGVIKLSSVSGDLAMQFKEPINANFRLSSNAGGNLINNITNDKAETPKYGPGAKLNFSTGNGSASVRGSTVSGNIKISN